MKKILLVILVIIIGILFAKNEYISWRTAAITTTANYATATDTEISCKEYIRKHIHIENTGVTNSMYYSVMGYASKDDTDPTAYVTDVSIAASDYDDVYIANSAFYKMVVRVKNNAGATTCYISVIMSP